MKFEYTHSVSFSQSMTAQMELSATQFPKNNSTIAFVLTIIVLFICVFGCAVLGILLFGQVAAEVGQIFGFTVGAILGFLIYNKMAAPRIIRFLAKQAIDEDKTFTSTYQFDENGIEVYEDGRFTKIEWSAISDLVLTKRYTGLLCKGLFYYIPNEMIGNQVSQKQFVSCCKQWIDNAKNA